MGSHLGQIFCVMTENELKRWVRDLAVRVVRLVAELPDSQAARIISGQLLRCSGSVGANYRAACRARSAADMLSKLGIVEEEADECCYWLEVLMESAIGTLTPAQELEGQYDQIVAIMVASRKTLARRIKEKGDHVRETAWTYNVDFDEPESLA